MTPMLRRTTPMVAMLVLALFWPSVSLGAEAKADVRTQWYQVLMEGQPAGWMKAVETRAKDAAGVETIQSDTDMSIAIRREMIAIEITCKTRFLETAAGKPISCSSTTKLGLMPGMDQVREMTFRDDGIEVVNRQGDQTTKQFVKYTPPGAGEGDAAAKQKDWLPPAASQRYIEACIAKGEKDIRYRSIDPSSTPQPIEVRLLSTPGAGEETVEVLGKVVPAMVWTQTMSNAPNVVMKAYTDTKGTPLKSTVDLGGMTMTLVAADEELAKAKVNPPELLVSTMVKPDRPIASPRALKKAVYELEVGPPRGSRRGGGNDASQQPSGGAAKLDLPTTAAQTVEPVKDKANVARVTVDLTSTGQADDKPGAEFLASSIMINFTDPKVTELKDRALKGVDAKASPAAKAEAMRRFVHGFINRKNLSVGLATASETARTKVGDCTEHAVLLAALLRGASIPSRTASGLLYVDEFVGSREIFGYHMWTQAWLEDGKGTGRWVDLDAVLGDETAFDAAHITLGTSAMADGAMNNDMVRFVPLMGRLSIRVIEPPGTPGTATTPAVPGTQAEEKAKQP